MSLQFANNLWLLYMQDKPTSCKTDGSLYCRTWIFLCIKRQASIFSMHEYMHIHQLVFKNMGALQFAKNFSAKLPVVIHQTFLPPKVFTIWYVQY